MSPQCPLCPSCCSSFQNILSLCNSSSSTPLPQPSQVWGVCSQPSLQTPRTGCGAGAMSLSQGPHCDTTHPPTRHLPHDRCAEKVHLVNNLSSDKQVACSLVGKTRFPENACNAPPPPLARPPLLKDTEYCDQSKCKWRDSPAPSSWHGPSGPKAVPSPRQANMESVFSLSKHPRPTRQHPCCTPRPAR